MSSTIYLEGGGDSNELKSRCREGFRKLLERMGFTGRMPRLVACGGRGAAYDAFTVALASADAKDFVALWVDSEDPMVDLEATWEHLRVRDGWGRPTNAADEQGLCMTTCMETLIVSDRTALTEHYGSEFQESALPALHDLEQRSRGAIQNSLTQATRRCRNAYSKGKRSFEVLGKLDPAVLRQHLPSFV